MAERKRKRTAEIIGVFARHNFYVNGFTPTELRTTLEDLGPTYVKIGQIMSSRTDMLPESYCAELEKLRSNVAPLDPAVVREAIEREAGKPIDEIYAEFRDEPIGSASIAQAHYGVLTCGTRVVTKVQRPGVAETMRSDFALLKKLASFVNMANEGADAGEAVDLMTVLEELEKVTAEELDFRVEAEYTRRFRAECIEDPQVISCPEVVEELTTERMLTMTFVDGYPLARTDKLDADGVDREAMARAILGSYLHQVLDVGTFHGDPHQGNIMVSGSVPYWIDFGMMGHIGAASIDALQEAVLALLRKDADALANAALSLGKATGTVDRACLVDGVEGLIGRYAGARNLADIDMGQLMADLSDLMAANRLSVPAEYTMLMRGLVTIEGVVEELCPEFDALSFLGDKFIERAKADLDAKAELAQMLESISSTAMRTASMPMMLFEALQGLMKGRVKVAIDLAGHEALADGLRAAAADVVLAVFACVLFLGSCILCATSVEPRVSGMPLIALAGFVVSVALGIYAVRSLMRHR